VSWADAAAFAEWLSAREADAGRRYRLPTEAEWEYACRAGTVTPYATGETVTTAQANFNGKQPYGNKSAPGMFRERPTRAGGFPSNAWGMSEMHGNVWEWVADWYAAYPAASPADPAGPSQGESRVLRGGAFFNTPRDLRSANRFWSQPAVWLGFIGFRCARGPRRQT
jgi:sulfatase modifying factor 1